MNTVSPLGGQNGNGNTYKSFYKGFKETENIKYILYDISGATKEKRKYFVHRKLESPLNHSLVFLNIWCKINNCC